MNTFTNNRLLSVGTVDLYTDKTLIVLNSKKSLYAPGLPLGLAQMSHDPNTKRRQN